MKAYWLLFCLFLSSCSNIPSVIQDAPEVDLSFQQVNQNPKQYQNAQVRWGGSIIEVENEQNFSLLQVLYYPLGTYGRPLLTEPSPGRFIIKSQHFLDPAFYTKDKEITIAGTVNEPIVQTIGKKELLLPAILANTLYVWPEYDNSSYYPGPWGYGFNPHFRNSPYPFYGPGYRSYYYGGYPYYW